MASYVKTSTLPLALACALLIAVPALGQSRSVLEAERQQVFSQLILDPVDRDLMAEYARLSVALQDYEAAAATLERLSWLEPGNTAVLLELAQSYFALGAFGLVELYATALIALNPPPEQLAAAEALLGAGNRQNGETRLTGELSFGYSHGDSAADRGATAGLALSWRVDMGGPHAHDWVTELGATGFVSGAGAGNTRQFLRLRTGPEFRITGESFGPRVQPFLQFTATRDSTDVDTDELLVGLAVQVPHNEVLTSFATLSTGQSVARDTGLETDLRDLSLGATFRPSTATSLRFTLRQRDEEDTAETSVTQGVRLDLSHAFSAPFDIGTRDWSAGGHVLYDEVEVSAGRASREESHVGYGLWMRAYVSGSAFFEARTSVVERRASLRAFNTEEVVSSLQFGWEF